jgi:hypothetical protein
MSALARVMAVVAAPLALAIVGVLHPRPLSVATAQRWADLHVVLLPLFPLALQHAPAPVDRDAVVGPLFAAGDQLGRVGAYALLVAAVAACVALYPRAGTRVWAANTGPAERLGGRRATSGR